MVSGLPVQANKHQRVLPNLNPGALLGGLNLTAWCQKQYGNGFKAKVIANNAGGWTCERGSNDRRPVQMISACKFQYGNKAYIAKPSSVNDPYSWKCYGKSLAPTMAGVKLDPWCKKNFGNAYKAKLVGSGARGWACERSIVDRRRLSFERGSTDRRPVQMISACKFQYGNKAYIAKPSSVNDPYSWKCYGKSLAPTMAGVKLDPWCKKNFGNAYKAKLVGSGARGWACERSIVDRRPINVKGACLLQYGQRVLEAKFLNVNDPNSWKCVLR